MEAVFQGHRTIWSTLAACGLAMALSTPALAEPKPYLGAGGALMNVSFDGIDDDADIAAFYGRAGMEFVDNISGELRAGYGLTEDEVDVFGGSVDIELDYFVGAYLRGSLPIHETVKPYAIIGLTKGQLTASANGSSDSGSENDFSFGFGVDIAIDERSSFGIEYMNYLDKDGTEITALGGSITAHF